MAKATLYEILGLSREQADEIARAVRESFSESNTPEEWISQLAEKFGVDDKNAEIFACGWFAGKYAGVSEVFNRVEKEIDGLERDEAEKKAQKSRYLPLDGYA